MTPDPKWLEILKASGWQTTALACAFGVFLLLSRLGFLPPQEPLVTTLIVLALLVCVFLALASIGHTTVEIFQPRERFVLWMKRRQQRRTVRKYIPHMTDQEKEIVAYLLEKNQKMITADQDGGFAATLISQGILTIAARRGQVLDVLAVPFVVPDHIWDELMAQKEHFPYEPVKGREAHPWRVPWMLR